jgi:Fic family protein
MSGENKENPILYNKAYYATLEQKLDRLVLPSHLKTVLLTDKLAFLRKQKELSASLDGVDGADEYLMALFIQYVNEVWIGEEPPKEIHCDTSEIVQHIMEQKNDKATEVLQKEGMTKDQATNIIQMIANIIDASQYLFGNNFRTYADDGFSLELILRMHKMIGCKLFDCGVLRKRVVGAIGSSVVYCIPTKIEHRLVALVKFANDHRNGDIETMLRLGTLFFSEFLLIHPFIDGNGRTARLLLNFLLKDVTVIPFSMYAENREAYLRVLEDRNDQTQPPLALGKYVLERACEAADNLASLML